MLVCAVCSSSKATADVSVNLPQGQGAAPVSPLRVDASTIGSVAAGCGVCRDSGNCSIAMNDTSSGVFCGDLHTAARLEPCCCPYYTECRVTSKSLVCECGGAWPFPTQLEAQRHERLSATEAANETEMQVEDIFTPEVDPMGSQMSVSTEILIHLSAYLALFVFAMYVDQWVECVSDFRRNQMVAYGGAVDMKMLRFRQRFGKRRQESEADTETDDNLPLLVLESPAPTSSPAFTFDEVAGTEHADTELAKTEVGDIIGEETKAVPKEVVVVTVPVDVVEEVSTSHPEPPAELQDIPL
ncbi:unnamed protein product [Phytophthora lilii]|uniref:Unnamed protein product n=1 Tax=Phytophthora lilii TaxID=2077276 RepID=A0A9W6TDE6_9STRA|nr:unnamed protein product [Phytophthora lilii]